MSVPNDTVLILTPVKDAASHLDRYFTALETLTYPADRLSLAFLESDSVDGTYERLEGRLAGLRARYRSVSLFKKDFSFRIPDGVPRWDASVQVARRITLAKSRNHLLFRALDDEAWVLWLDVDVDEYPPDILERLLAAGKSIVQPNCVLEYGGSSYDRNAWRDKGRLHLDDLRDEGDLVPLDAVGGTMLLVAADVHRDGLVFPPFLYGRRSPLIRPSNGFARRGGILRFVTPTGAGEVETEGFGILAHDMGHECWGMPNLEIRHRNE